MEGPHLGVVASQDIMTSAECRGINYEEPLALQSSSFIFFLSLSEVLAHDLHVALHMMANSVILIFFQIN